MSLSGADPHGLTEHEAASIHVYTQETRFYHTLNEHLRGTDRSKVEPYKPCVCAMPLRHMRTAHTPAQQLPEAPSHRSPQDSRLH